MKGLVIGDQHFKIDNIDQVDVFIKKLRKLLQQEKYDFIVSGGDLLDTHERLHTLALNKADQYLKMLSSFAKTFVIVGNHDMINPSQFLTENHWLNVYKGWTDDLVVVDKVVEHKIDDCKLLFVPYVPDGRFKEALDTKENWKEADVIFAHQTLDGVKMGAIMAENVESWEDDLPNVVAFHVHDLQKVKKNLYYTGSCMQHSFGEGSSKYVYEVSNQVGEFMIDEDGDDIKMKGDIYLTKVDLQLPRKKIIHCTTKDLEDMKSITDIVPEKFDKYFEIKIVITGSLNAFKVLKKRNDVKQLLSKYKSLFKNETLTIDKKDTLEDYQNFQQDFQQTLQDYFKSKGDSDLFQFYNELIKR